MRNSNVAGMWPGLCSLCRGTEHPLEYETEYDEKKLSTTIGARNYAYLQQMVEAGELEPWVKPWTRQSKWLAG
jgi:hypothetical protein